MESTATKLPPACSNYTLRVSWCNGLLNASSTYVSWRRFKSRTIARCLSREMGAEVTEFQKEARYWKVEGGGRG